MKDILIKNFINIDWEIILIDTSTKFGYNSIKKSEWHNHAKILSYISHDKMPEIYKQIDVLLFPSECNESFGLMVREAIANDVFVICSECAGPASAIVNKINGLTFPKKDEKAFIKCLEYVFENKYFIKNYRTTNYGDIRTFEEQADELYSKYHEIIANPVS